MGSTIGALAVLSVPAGMIVAMFCMTMSVITFNNERKARAVR